MLVMYYTIKYKIPWTPLKQFHSLLTLAILYAIICFLCILYIMLPIYIFLKRINKFLRDILAYDIFRYSVNQNMLNHCEYVYLIMPDLSWSEFPQIPLLFFNYVYDRCRRRSKPTEKPISASGEQTRLLGDSLGGGDHLASYPPLRATEV